MERLFFVENVELLKCRLEIRQVVDARGHQGEDGLEVRVLLHHRVGVDEVSDTAGAYNRMTINKNFLGIF